MSNEEKKVLIVDDEREFLLLLGKMVRTKGYKVLAADNGKDALEIAKEERPDLIIMDIMMPKMDGASVGKKLQESENTKGIPIIYLTGLISQEEEMDEGHVVAGNVIFAKPCKMEELFDAMENLMAGNRP